MGGTAYLAHVWLQEVTVHVTATPWYQVSTDLLNDMSVSRSGFRLVEYPTKTVHEASTRPKAWREVGVVDIGRARELRWQRLPRLSEE